MGSRLPDYLTATPGSREAMLAHWDYLCDSPEYAKIEGKFETTIDGRITVSPARTKHSLFQSRIVRLLHPLENALGLRGEPLTESAILTADGVKVPDVAWAEKSELAAALERGVFLKAPRICVEVLSPGNSSREMTEKIALYFAAGSDEVWLCDDDGEMQFWRATGRVAHSPLFPNFPASIANL